MSSAAISESYDSYINRVERECRECSQDVYRLLLGVARDHDMAHDAVQDAIPRVVRYAGQYGLGKKIENVKGFLITAAKRVLLTKLRKKDNKRNNNSLDDERNTEILNRVADYETACEIQKRIEREEILRMALRDATPEEVRVLNMIGEGCTCVEIAEGLNISVETAKLRIAKIKGRLRYRIINKLSLP